MANQPILLGPNPAQPFDIQTQQAQLAQQQALSYAMLQQALQGGAPTIHTGGGNPFARDVVNLAPLGNVVTAALSRNRIAEVQAQQQELANQYLKRHTEELQRALSPTMPGGAPSVMGTQRPDMFQAGLMLSQSPDKENAMFGQKLLETIAAGQKARQFTADTAAALAKAKVNPASVTTTLGDFGNPLMEQGNVNALQIMPEFKELPPQHTGYAYSPQTGTVSPPMAQPSAQPDIVTPPESTLPGGQPNTSGVTQQTSRTSGKMGPQEGAATVAAEAAAKVAGETLSKDQLEGMQDANDFKYSYLPQYYSMTKIIQKALANGGNFGFGGEEINTVRMLLAQAGLAPDAAGNITDFNTFVKSAVPLAAGRLREAVGARPSTMEFVQYLEALAAKGNTDPQSMMNIVQDRILGSLNGIEKFHAQNPNLERISPLAARASQFSRVDPADIQTEMANFGIKTNWKKNATGSWQNYDVAKTGQPQTSIFGGAQTPGTQSLPPGWSLVPQ